MARMIPSVLSPEIKSNAEKKIFEWFRDAPDTDGWVVLHSLGIANHKSLIYGEIDFFVIAPKLGVFALEVKGGRVSRIDGNWHFTNRYGEKSSKSRGPFEQASEGVFSLMETVKNRCGSTSRLSRLLFGSGVMFPDITFDIDNVDENPWQVFDQRDGQNVVGFIRRLSSNFRRKWEEIYGVFPLDKLPDSKDVKELAHLLRGDFDKAVSLGTQIRTSEQELILLTEEQLKCLDQLEDNPRCLIQGAAGTGKTLLAIEETKRSVVRGSKVAFFCFNSMLANWLKGYFSALDCRLQPSYIGTFHAFMLQASKEADIPVSLPEDDIQGFWQEEMPIITLEAVEKIGTKYDKIIIDEAQDLINENYIEVFDAILNGGIERGRWSMFGDFSNQAIYSELSGQEMKELLDKHTAYIKYRLRINCRNTKPIGEEIKCITGFDSSEYLWTKVDGPPVNYYTWRDDEEQKSKLVSVLGDLKKGNVKSGNITILSPVRREDSIISTLLQRISDYSPDAGEQITFSTIQAYKGLENSVIILTDIKTYEHEKLLYVGLSRARSGLIVFESEGARKERTKLLMRWVK